MSRPPSCDCRCEPATYDCAVATRICGVAFHGVNRRCWPTGEVWQNETPHRVTTFTGVAAWRQGQTCVTDITGRIWRKRLEPLWHIYNIVHTADDPLRDIAFVVRQAGANEEQEIKLLGGPTGGTFTLTFDDTGSNPQTTAPIAFDASLADVQAALESLSNIDVVAVTGGPLPDTAIVVEFLGSHEFEDLRTLIVDVAGLTGPDPITARVRTLVAGRAHITVGVAVGDNGTLLRSDDHGATWSVVTLATSENLLRVAGDGRYWYSVGENGVFLKSSDHGATWSLIDAAASTETFFDIAVAGRKLWIAGSADVLRSTDRGETWATVAGTTGTATCVVTDRDETTWLFASAVGQPGTCWKTTDQGANWDEHTLVGDDDAIVRAGLYFDDGDVGHPQHVHVVSDLTLSSPTLTEIGWNIGYDSIARFSGDLYRCGESLGMLPNASGNQSPCLGGSPTRWDVHRIDKSVDFSYCPVAAFYGEDELGLSVTNMVQTADVPGCVWESYQQDLPCDFPGAGTQLAKWTLDLSGDTATLTFTMVGGPTAVYTLPIAEWNVRAGNLMVFDEDLSTGGPTGHDELWVCPGTYEPCGICFEASWAQYEVTWPAIPGVTAGGTATVTYSHTSGASTCVFTGGGVTFAPTSYLNIVGLPQILFILYIDDDHFFLSFNIAWRPGSGDPAIDPLMFDPPITLDDYADCEGGALIVYSNEGDLEFPSSVGNASFSLL